MILPTTYLRMRVARPTDRMAAQRRFYVDGLALTVRSEWQGHAGYDGLVVGDRAGHWQIEFVHQPAVPAAFAPHPENLLVFYVHDRDELAQCAARMAAIGAAPVRPDNPYWVRAGLTYEDPDGARVVVALTPTFLDDEDATRAHPIDSAP